MDFGRYPALFILEPIIVISPERRGTRPNKEATNVLLPAPLGPTKAVSLSANRSKETSSTTTLEPLLTVRFLTEAIGYEIVQPPRERRRLDKLSRIMSK